MEIILYYTNGVAWQDVVVYAAQYMVLLAVLWRIVYQPYMHIVRKRQKEAVEARVQVERAKALLRDAPAKRAEILAGKR